MEETQEQGPMVMVLAAGVTWIWSLDLEDEILDEEVGFT